MNPPSPAFPRVVADTNLFVAAGFKPSSDAARILEAVREGTLRLVWDEATRRETDHVVGKIPPLRGTNLSGYFFPGGRYDGRPTPTPSISSPIRRTASSPPWPRLPGRCWSPATGTCWTAARTAAWWSSPRPSS